jgi:hypothetical protein
VARQNLGTDAHPILLGKSKDIAEPGARAASYLRRVFQRAR